MLAELQELKKVTEHLRKENANLRASSAAGDKAVEVPEVEEEEEEDDFPEPMADETNKRAASLDEGKWRGVRAKGKKAKTGDEEEDK